MSLKARQTSRARASSLRSAVELAEATAEAAQRNEKSEMEMINRSDDFVLRPPSDDLVMVTTSAGLMPLWKARAMCVGYTQTALRADEAPDRWQEPPATVRNGEDCSDEDQRHERAMGLEDCNDEGEEREIEQRLDGGSRELARSIAHPDESDDEDANERKDRDMARLIVLVERTIARIDPMLDEIRDLRALVAKQNVLIAKQNELLAAAALLARQRGEGATNGEDVPGEDVEAPAEEPPAMLN
jgi:hypothetical protein